MSHSGTQHETETQATKRDPLPPLWEGTDDMWDSLFLPMVTELDLPSKRGRHRANSRKCLDGMIYRARTGCYWNHLSDKRECSDPAIQP